MTQKYNKLWRSMISIGLVITLVFGTVAMAFADTGATQADTDSIKYVSLGDSMSNGYGLTGYDHQGYREYGEVAYPNQFAAWLEETTGKAVEHERLAISGTRVEDLHFLLDFPMKNGSPDSDAVAVAETPAPYWNGELANEWNNTFSLGDWYTWEMFTNDRWRWHCGGTDAAVKVYRDAIEEADIISMATGNANFGVFATERIGVAMGTTRSDVTGNEWLDSDRLLKNCDPEMQEYLLKLTEELKPLIKIAIESMGSPIMTEKADELIDVLTYVCVSYVVNYAGALEVIMELNPDVELILMGVMDTKGGIDIAFEQEDGSKDIVNIMEIVGMLMDPVNSYIAGLPAMMQEDGNELYSQATFYYADSPEVAVLGSEFGSFIDDPDSVARERFVESIVGADGDADTWAVFTSAFNEMELLKKRNLELVPVTLEDVLAYKSGKYTGLTNSEIFSCGVYMAVEEGVIECSKNYAVNFDALLSVTTGFEEQMVPVVNALTENETKIFAKGNTVFQSAKKAEQILYKTFMNDETIIGLLHTIGRTQIGNGIGGHPSEAGHDALAEAFINAYKDGYLVSDARSVMMDDLMATLLKASPSMFDSQQQIVGKLKKAVNNLDSYAKAEVDRFASEVKPAYAGKDLDAELKVVEKELGEVRKVVKVAKSAIGTLASAVTAADAGIIENGAATAKSVETIGAVVDTKMAAVDKAISELNAAVTAASRKAEKLGVDNAALRDVASEMRSYAALASVTKDTMKSESRQLAYAPVAGSTDPKSSKYNPDASYYVALGDTSATAKMASNAYGRKLVKELGLDYRTNFSNEGMDGLRVDDLLYMLDENYEPDAYAKAEFSGKAERNRDDLIAKIEKADLITVGFSNNTLMDIAISQMIRAFGGKATYEIDWGRYLDAETAASVENMMVDIEAAAVEATAGMSGSGINMSNIGVAARAAIESYIYNYLGFYINYQDAMNKIAEINPDAKLVLIGISNPFNSTNLIMGKDVLPLGEYMSELTDLMNLQQSYFAMMTGKAVYVDAPDVEVNSSAYAGNMQLMSFISNLMIKGIDTLDTSTNGHTYIKNQIMSVMKVVDPATEAAMDQLTGLYDLLYITPAGLDEAEAQISAARTEYDALIPAQKKEVDADLVQLLEFCEDDFDYVKVAAVANSNVTNLKAKLPTKTKLTVSWKGVSGAQKYTVKIYRNGKLFKTVNTNKKTVSLTGITRGCTYRVTVAPVVSVNGTSFTGVTKSASVVSKLDKANLTVKKYSAKVTVKSKDQNSTGFQVWVAKDKAFKKDVTKKTFKTNNGALNKTVALKKGANYIKVRAYTTVNGKTIYGAWSKFVTVNR